MPTGPRRRPALATPLPPLSQPPSSGRRAAQRYGEAIGRHPAPGRAAPSPLPSGGSRRGLAGREGAGYRLPESARGAARLPPAVAVPRRGLPGPGRAPRARRTDCPFLLQSSHKTFKIKRFLAKKQKQNRPIPQWIRMKTGNKIR